MSDEHEERIEDTCTEAERSWVRRTIEAPPVRTAAEAAELEALVRVHWAAARESVNEVERTAARWWFEAWGRMSL